MSPAVNSSQSLQSTARHWQMLLAVLGCAISVCVFSDVQSVTDAPNCDATQGAVDLDRCPQVIEEMRREEERITATAWRDCSGLSGVNEIIKCNENRLKSAEGKMASVLEELNRLLPSDSENGSPRAALTNEQTAWLRYRKARCDLSATTDPEGGRWRAVAFIQCAYEMTAFRVSELDKRRAKLLK